MVVAITRKHRRKGMASRLPIGRLIAFVLSVSMALGMRSPTAAQEGSITIPSTTNELFMRNTANQALGFQLAVDDGDYANFTLGPNEGSTFFCQPRGNCTVKLFSFRILSNNILKSYSEPPGTKVKIAWNDTQQCWDFYKDN
jgi:hypothetical protein